MDLDLLRQLVSELPLDDAGSDCVENRGTVTAEELDRADKALAAAGERQLQPA